eukprot:403335526
MFKDESLMSATRKIEVLKQIQEREQQKKDLYQKKYLSYERKQDLLISYSQNLQLNIPRNLDPRCSTSELRVKLASLYQLKLQKQAAIRIQTWFRMIKNMRKFRKVVQDRVKGALVIQKIWKRYILYKVMPNIIKFTKRQASVKIQKYLKSYLAKKQVDDKRKLQKLNQNFEYFDKIRKDLETELARKVWDQWRRYKRVRAKLQEIAIQWQEHQTNRQIKKLKQSNSRSSNRMDSGTHLHMSVKQSPSPMQKQILVSSSQGQKRNLLQNNKQQTSKLNQNGNKKVSSSIAHKHEQPKNQNSFHKGQNLLSVPRDNIIVVKEPVEDQVQVSNMVEGKKSQLFLKEASSESSIDQDNLEQQAKFHGNHGLLNSDSQTHVIKNSGALKRYRMKQQKKLEQELLMSGSFLDSQDQNADRSYMQNDKVSEYDLTSINQEETESKCSLSQSHIPQNSAENQFKFKQQQNSINISASKFGPLSKQSNSSVKNFGANLNLVGLLNLNNKNALESNDEVTTYQIRILDEESEPKKILPYQRKKTVIIKS